MRLVLPLSLAAIHLRPLLIFSSTITANHRTRLHRHLSSLSTSPSMAASDDIAGKYGFDRPEMYSSSLSNTVESYDRHVFLCYKSYDSWPSRLEVSDADPLPKLLNAAVKARRDDMPLKTRVTVCSGCTGVGCSDGDVLIFPDMIKYRALKESDVDSFVEDVLVNGKPWASGPPETFTGAYVFVCAHGSRDKRCGECGPILMDKFNEEITARGLDEHIFVSACSHIGGHKYAGNIIIFGTDGDGKVIGDWYGYVTPNDVPNLIDLHIGKGEIIEKLWRGQMGLKDEAVVKPEVKKTYKEVLTEAKQETPTSCCQGTGAVSCCREPSSAANGEVIEEKKTSDGGPTKKNGMTFGIGKWEQSDVLMAAGIVGAVATVAVAYTVFKRSA